jgi:hypothetical protein
MRILIAALAAATSLTAVPAVAQSANAEYRRDVRQAQREYQRDVRDARQDRREDLRDWRRYRNYDYNRLPPGQRTYYADRFYRDGRYYRPVRLNRASRIYRGSNGRYYCRRSDGTTGLIIGGISGAAIGAALANGRSTTLGALVGGAGGALLGQSIDRGGVTCR